MLPRSLGLVKHWNISRFILGVALPLQITGGFHASHTVAVSAIEPQGEYWEREWATTRPPLPPDAIIGDEL